MLSVKEKLQALSVAVDNSGMMADAPHQLPELMRLINGIIFCDLLAKRNQPYEHRLKETLETLPVIREYFATKTGAMQIIPALIQLENEITQLLPHDKPKVR